MIYPKLSRITLHTYIYIQIFLNRINVKTKKSSAYGVARKVHGELAKPAEVNKPVRSET